MSEFEVVFHLHFLHVPKIADFMPMQFTSIQFDFNSSFNFLFSWFASLYFQGVKVINELKKDAETQPQQARQILKYPFC